MLLESCEQPNTLGRRWEVGNEKWEKIIVYRFTLHQSELRHRNDKESLEIIEGSSKN